MTKANPAMPAVIQMRIKPERPFPATTRQVHGLACALFEGAYSADHAGQEKPFAIWPLRPDPGDSGDSGASGGGWLWQVAWLRPGRSHLNDFTHSSKPFLWCSTVFAGP